jgi:hypothetical protein
MLAVLLLAGYLRLTHGADHPGWFADEGTHLAIAQQVLAGRAQYLAVGDSTLLFARLPLFEWLLAGALALAGAGPEDDPARGMAVLRALTGMLGVVTTGLLYWVVAWVTAKEGEKAGGGGHALGAALIYALWPPALIYSRLGFSYNLLAPLGLLVFWGAAEAQAAREARAGGHETRPMLARLPLCAAALALGLGTLVDLWMWVLLPPLLAAVAWRGWGGPRAALFRELGLVLILAVGPFALYALIQLLTVPAPFLFDLRFTLGRLGALSLPAQAATLGSNLAILAGQDGVWALGLLGLFALRPVRAAGLALLFTLVPLALLGRTTPLHSLSYYYLIPLLPFAALGAAALLAALLRSTWPPLRAALAVFLALLGLAALGQGLGQVRSGFTTAIDPFLLAPAEARAAAGFVAGQRAPGDLVLASPGLAWLLPGETADFQMALAHAGLPTPHVPADLPRERYRFDPSFERARFVIVDPLWRNWGVFNVAGLAAVLAEVEQWPVAFQSGGITVHARP